MKIKLSKILGVGLALVLVFSLAFAIMPTEKAQAQEGNMQWAAQPLPTGVYNILASGSTVTDLAVAADGLTVYVIDNTVACNVAGVVMKSVDGGQSFNVTSAPSATGGVPLCIGVASDNPNAIAVVETAAPDIVHRSNDGGVTWATLPVLPTAGVSQDVAVSPARLGAIFERDYAVAMGDPADNGILGELDILGVGATPAAWTSYNAGDATDYMACRFSPAYAGDWVLGSVSATNNAVNVELWNNQTGALQIISGTPARVAINTTVDDLGDAGTGIVAGDLVFPIDFDVTSGAYTRTYASFASQYGVTSVNAGGVARVDALLGWTLLNTHHVKSIDFAGTAYNAEGLPLFIGDFNAAGLGTNVWTTTQPTINLPAWYPSLKAPTGGGGQAVVRVAADYGATLRSFVATRGIEGALSISNDGGVSYNQEAMIDTASGNTLVAVQGMALSPDGANIFIGSDDGAQLSLWKSTLPVNPFSWQRVYCANYLAGGAASTLNINRAEWADNPEVYFAETPAQAGGFYVSLNGGATFATRTAPAIGTVIASIGPETSKTVFVGQGTNIFKSTNGGQVWGPPAAANAGAGILTIIPAGGGHVVVGGFGAASLSTNGGVSFNILQPGLPGAGRYIVIPDEEYATNNLLYAGNVFAAQGSVVYRLDTVNYASWEALANPTAGTQPAQELCGLGMSNGTFYAMTDGDTATAECDRTLIPHFAVGDMVWSTMNAGAPPGTGAQFDVAQNKLYVHNGATGLWAYNDFMATASTTINVPASGASIPIDPVTGRAIPLQVSWDAVGTGTGLGTTFLFAIFEKNQGFPGAIFAGVAGLPLPTAPSNTIWPAGAVAPDVNYIFLGGVEYGLMIAATSEVSGDGVGSQWSDPVFFAIEPSTGIISPPHAGPMLTSPTPGNQNVDPGTGFSWNPMSGVTDYELIIATDAALANAVAGTPVTLTTTSYQAELEYATDYWYGVRATAPTSSVQTIGAFRTMDEPVEKYTCQYDGLTFNTRGELEAHLDAVHGPATPLYIWIVIAIGAILVIAVVWLIFTTRRA